MTDHDQLRARAEAATPEPWELRQGAVVDAGGAIVVRGPRIGERAARGQIEDAHFIAAASPDRIIALLDEIAALRAERAWQPIETAPRDCCVIGWADEWEASSAGVLRCKLTHAEAQIEAAERALEDVAPGLLAEHAPVFGAILELGERLRAAEARTAWQPIETAPMGQWVLACYAHDGREPVVVRRRPVIRRPRSLDGSIFEDGHRAQRGVP